MRTVKCSRLLFIAFWFSAAGYSAAGDTYTLGASGTFAQNSASDPSHPSKVATLGDFWFYDAGSHDDPAFGFNNVVVQVFQQSRGVRLLMTYSNNGHEGGSGSGSNLKLVLYSDKNPIKIIEQIPFSVGCHSGEFKQFEAFIPDLKVSQLTWAQLPGGGSQLSVTC